MASKPFLSDTSQAPFCASADRTSGRRRKRSVVAASAQPALQDNDWLRCSFCHGDNAFTARTTGGLLPHISTTHQGATMSAQQAQHLTYLGKVCCVQCGSLRDHKRPTCYDCGGCTRSRNAKPGDRVLERERQRLDGAVEVSSAVPSAGDIDQAIAPATSAPEADRRDTDDANSLPEVVHSGADLSQESVNEISAPARRLTMPRNLEEMMRGVPLKGLKHIPLASAGKCATAWAECLEGSMAGSAVWGQIAEFRTRLLFCGYSPDCDKPVELKTRLKLWEKGKFNELAARASSSALLCAEKSNHTHDGNNDLKRGDIARSKACDDALRKAIQGFVNGVVTPTPEQRTAWAELFLPQGELDQMANSAEL